jgi:hypothetical protein
MNLKSRRQYEARARIAKALATESAVILDALAEGNGASCELTRWSGRISPPSQTLGGTGTRHRGRPQGRRPDLYRVKICCLQGLWQCIESVLKQNFDEQRAAIEA